MSYVFLSDTLPVAAKQYVCWLCGLPILKGKLHIKRAAVFEGHVCSTRMHTECENHTRGWSQDDWEDYGNIPREFRQMFGITEPDRPKVYVLCNAGHPVGAYSDKSKAVKALENRPDWRLQEVTWEDQ